MSLHARYKMTALFEALCATVLLLVMGGCVGLEEQGTEFEQDEVNQSQQAIELSQRRQRIAGGNNHTLAVRQDGTVWSWGYNYYGQLGNGTTSTTAQTTPIQVPNFTNVVSVAAGASHSLALKSDGTVWAWGYNYYGQLGNGTSSTMTTPVKVSSLTGVIAIAASNNHSLALKSDGTVWGWGYNGYGQLGDNTASSRYIPVQVRTSTGTLTGVVAIATGQFHSLAVTADGSVWAWGYNAYGQLGNGTSTTSYVARQAVSLSRVVAVAAGQYHSIALHVDGKVSAFGYNAYGQLGDNSTTNRLVPTPVVNLNDARAIVTGFRHTLALRANGTVVGWGYNAFGQLGVGWASDQELTPTAVAGSLTGVEAIGAGAYFSVALVGTGGIRSWGMNTYGELGIGSTTNQSSPASAGALSGLVEASAGEMHSVAVKWDGTVWTWGMNTYGQLGDGTPIRRLTPVQVKTSSSTYLNEVTKVAAGAYHTLALRSDGTVWAWGQNGFGQVGDAAGGTNRFYAMQVRTASGNLSGVVAIAAGSYHSLALRYDGTVWAWGANAAGQLGLFDGGTIASRDVAVPVAFISDIVSIAGGGNHSLAAAADGSAYAWGSGSDGQLCDYIAMVGYVRDYADVIPNVTMPTRRVVAVAAGLAHSLMLMSDGTAFSCGDNQHGQLGDMTNTDASSPVAVIGLNNAVQIASSGNHALAMGSDGSVWAWGSNANGQLGLGTTTNSNIIEQIPSFSDLTGIAAGTHHSVAVRPDGRIWTWGRNNQGQLGNGTYSGTVNTLSPAQSFFNP